jgi:hypothetical protein
MTFAPPYTMNVFIYPSSSPDAPSAPSNLIPFTSVTIKLNGTLLQPSPHSIIEKLKNLANKYKSLSPLSALCPAGTVSLSDFDQQPDAISTINNKHYQFHDYDENAFNENGNGNNNNEHNGEVMQSALNRGPYFDISASKNVTALIGSTAYLNCRVKNLGNKTVRMRSASLCSGAIN